MKSVGSMIQLIAGLAGTQDVDERTSEFIEDMVRITDNGKKTSGLSEPRVKWIEDIYKRHFD
jgi:hypothetical protein